MESIGDVSRKWMWVEFMGVVVRRNMYIDFLILLIPTLLVRICSFLQPKLTHDDHDKLLPSQLSTLIASLEQQCYKPSGA